MIGKYIKAEHLKFKRAFARKIIVIVPLINICFSFLVNLGYFVSGTFNWWSIIFMPIMISLLCASSHQKEKKASNYNGVFSAPVDLKTMWYAKVAVIAIYSLASQVIFLGFMYMMGFVIPQFATVNLAIITASLLLWATTVWEIPLCLFLAGRFGFAAAVTVNLFGSLILGIMSASEALWWLNPWSWAIRMMCPAIGIHPNGLPLENGDPLHSWTVVPSAVLLSAMLFAVLMIVTKRSFSPAFKTGGGIR